MGLHRNMGLLVAYSLIFMVTIDNINAGGSNCIEDNVAMPGNDIVETSPEGIKTKEDCCNACKNKEGCTFFTYRKEKEKCWLKNSDAGRKVDEEAVSGSVDCCKGTVKPQDAPIAAPDVAYIKPCPEDLAKNKQLTE